MPPYGLHGHKPLTEVQKTIDGNDRQDGPKLDQQLTLMAVLLVVAFAGIVVSFLIGRNVSRPVVAMSRATRELAGRG